jgi:hypothetical protein
MINLVFQQRSLQQTRLFQQAQATIVPTTIILANMSKLPLKHSAIVDEL